ncbi:MAG: hypothetical protein KTR33_10050 [Gammaproteobacteria bacterium]|nr:hypothetical protein [Gammaproteobacteria bacterium]
MSDNGTPIPDDAVSEEPQAGTAPADKIRAEADLIIAEKETQLTGSGENLSNFTDYSQPGTRERVIAACRSLGAIGYADTPMGQINRVQNSAHRWIRSVQLVIDASEAKLMFPDGTPTLQQIHRLAILHDKPLRPPRRFVCGIHGAHAKRRTPHALREALAISHALTDELSQHHHWVKATLPQTEEMVDLIGLLLDRRVTKRWSWSRFCAAREFKPYIREGQSLSRVIVSGNLLKLHGTLDRVCRFAAHEHFSRLLGPSFEGINTSWRDMAVQVGFSQSLLDIVQKPAVASHLVTHWHEHAKDIYALSRLASAASRRGRKLSRLANRLYKVGPTTEHLLLCARKSAERLALWVKLIQSAEPEFSAYEHLTPRQLLHRLAPAPLVIEDLEEFDPATDDLKNAADIA